MSRHRGSCHCGRVTFEIALDIERIVICNCSVCTKKGIAHVRVEDSEFELTGGEAELTLYTFASGDARHWFCRHCGIHPFGRPRFDPSRYTVNARCLDDYDDIAASADRVHFDGKHHPSDR